MTTIISGSSPSITFSDSTTQTTAFTSTPSVTSITTSADATINGVTVGRGASGPTSNTAVGRSALTSNSSGNTNSAFGSDSLKITDTGYANSAFGGNTLTSNTSGYFNSAFGTSALNGNVSGANNVAVGYQALFVNTASNNTAVGYKSGVKTTSGTNNVFVGIESGTNNITGQGNTFVGRASGLLNTGSYNCFVGQSTSAGESCGFYMTTGTKNTILGGFNGNQDGLDIRTLDYRVVISDGNGFPYLQLGQASGTARSLAFDGAEFFPTSDNTISCGYPSLRWSVVYAATGTINTSDRNLKQDISELDDAEKRVAIAIKSLIKKYRFKESVAEKGDNARIHVGAIAQEVASAFEAEGLDPTHYGLFCSDTWYEVDGNKLNPGGEFYKSTDESVVEVTQLGLRYEELLAFVISAM